MLIAKLITVVIIGYLLGSIPFGVLVARRMAKVEVTDYGSGKIGTTNVFRTVGVKAAVMVACLDLLKGGLAVLIAGVIVGESFVVVGGYSVGILAAQVLAALAAIAGHIWSVFLKFKGGRGVAPFLGALFVLCPVAGLFGGELLVAGALLTRYASLGSISATVGSCAILLPLTIMSGFPIEYLIYALIGTAVIIFMHRDNIARLIAGTERRLGEKAEKGVSPPAS